MLVVAVLQKQMARQTMMIKLLLLDWMILFHQGVSEMIKNEIVGFDVDLAKEVGKRLSMEVVLQPINWDTK